MYPYSLDIQANTKDMTERPSTWIKGCICSTYRDLLARSTTMDFMHLLISKPVKRRAEMWQLQAGRPTIFSVEAKQPTPTLGGDQERPREGRQQMEEILGRPAYGRPAGPTLQPLGLRFGVEVKHTDYNCFPQTPPALPAKIRPWSAINRTLIPHL